MIYSHICMALLLVEPEILYNYPTIRQSRFSSSSCLEQLQFYCGPTHHVGLQIDEFFLDQLFLITLLWSNSGGRTHSQPYQCCAVPSAVTQFPFLFLGWVTSDLSYYAAIRVQSVTCMLPVMALLTYSYSVLTIQYQFTPFLLFFGGRAGYCPQVI